MCQGKEQGQSTFVPLTSLRRSLQNQLIPASGFGSLFPGHFLLPLRLIETPETKRGTELWHKT
jgi:hypothetical protein